MSWGPLTVAWSGRSARDLEREDRVLRSRVVAAVERYASTGQGDVKRLQGVDDEWRLRVGDWRVRFTRDTTIRVLTVLRVLPRGSAYGR